MTKHKLTIAYDGTNYCGWQVQPQSDSIQAIIQRGLETFLQHPIQVVGAGRTDAGVHAHAQVAHFISDRELVPTRFLLGVNSVLPRDIRIKKIECVPDDFHARYSAKRKIYHYHICHGRIVDPFRRLYTYHHRGQLDIEKLVDAKELLVGTHDFKGFANSGDEGVAARDSTRTIHRIDYIEEGENSFRLEFEGTGFLRQMVRNLVGTLLEIGSGKREASSIGKIFEERERKLAGATAPAHGLFLVEVIYP